MFITALNTWWLALVGIKDHFIAVDILQIFCPLKFMMRYFRMIDEMSHNEKPTFSHCL